MRKILIAFLVAALALSVSVSAASAQPGKPITPPEIKQLILIHYAGPDNPGKPPHPGKPPKEEPEPVMDKYELLGLYLPKTATYYVNPDRSGVEPEAVVGAVKSGFEAWDEVTAEELFGDDVATTEVADIERDGQNTVFWVMIVPPKYVAICSIWYLDDGDPETLDPIVEFDIAFNSKHDWGIDPVKEDEVTIDAFDIQNVVTHEAGHAVGLDDLTEDQYRLLTMYGYTSEGETIKCSLEKGDILGTHELYGE